VFACLILAASLASPTEHPPAGATMWGVLYTVGCHRYWFRPSLAFVWVLLWCLRSGAANLKSAAVIPMCLMAFGIVLNWKDPASKNLHFAEYAKAFDAAPAGTVMIIPENEPDWNMRLVKHISR